MTMLTISDEQVESLRKTFGRKFAARIAQVLRSEMPEVVEPLPDTTLLAEVESRAARGRQLGLWSEADLASFVTFGLVVDAEVVLQPSFKSIWADAQADGPTKVAKTRELLKAHHQIIRG